MVAQTDPGIDAWNCNTTVSTARRRCTDTKDRRGIGVVQSGSTVVPGLRVDVDTWAVRMGHSEDPESGMNILEMNFGKTQIGRRRIGSGDMGAFGGGGMRRAVTRWNAERPPVWAHRPAQPTTSCPCTVSLIGDQRKVS